MITNVKDAKRIISNRSPKFAFIIGNGINRFAFKDKNVNPSWDKLLLDAWKAISFSTVSNIDEGITFTEFYDLLECETSDSKQIVNSIIDNIEKWGITNYHKALRDALIKLDCPVLTTNFDMCLEGDANKKVIINHPTIIKRFTDYYPWNVVCGTTGKFTIEDIYKYGIWHVNGLVDYSRSLKLSLSSYTRQSKRALEFIHFSEIADDFKNKNKDEWKGINTWLNLIFNCDLFILGLGLDEQETFLRWLLIQRMKYFHKYPERKRKGWYVGLKSDMKEGKKFFLEHVGFELIQLKSYKEIYLSLLDVKIPGPLSTK